MNSKWKDSPILHRSTIPRPRGSKSWGPSHCQGRLCLALYPFSPVIKFILTNAIKLLTNSAVYSRLQKRSLTAMEDLTCHTGSHSVNCYPAQMRILPLPSAEAGTRFSDPGGMQSWVDLCYVKTDRLGTEPVTCQSQVQRPTAVSSRNISSPKTRVHSQL